MVEDKLSVKARGDLRSLFASVPTEATLVEVDPVTLDPRLATQREVAASSLTPGDYCLVKAGERIPVDGASLEPDLPTARFVPRFDWHFSQQRLGRNPGPMPAVMCLTKRRPHRPRLGAREQRARHGRVPASAQE